MPSSDPTILRLQRQRYAERNRERLLAAGRKSDRKRRDKKRAYLREWVKRNPEKAKANGERYRLRNATTLAERKREYYLRNRERLLLKQKRYYEANKPKCLAWQKDYHAKHPEVGRKSKSNYRLKNLKALRIKHRALSKAYYYKNQERCKARAKYHARIRSRRIKWLGDKQEGPKIIGFMLKAKSDPNVKCAYCAVPLFRKAIEFDHRIPIARGGRHAASNLCASCPDCNKQKRDKTPEEFAEYRKEMA